MNIYCKNEGRKIGALTSACELAKLTRWLLEKQEEPKQLRAPAQKKRSSSNGRWNTESMQLLQLQEVKNDDGDDAFDRQEWMRLLVIEQEGQWAGKLHNLN